mmetsp:Transcript_22139/g.43029  ORF Transcript_22139/g.43029 Transcript_22139/m.43029 type:complete len:224 (+) Transcript_22139:745-1416(+)
MPRATAKPPSGHGDKVNPIQCQHRVARKQHHPDVHAGELGALRRNDEGCVAFACVVAGEGHRQGAQVQAIALLKTVLQLLRLELPERTEVPLVLVRSRVVEEEVLQRLPELLEHPAAAQVLLPPMTGRLLRFGYRNVVLLRLVATGDVAWTRCEWWACGTLGAIRFIARPLGRSSLKPVQSLDGRRTRRSGLSQVICELQSGGHEDLRSSPPPQVEGYLLPIL